MESLRLSPAYSVTKSAIHFQKLISFNRNTYNIPTSSTFSSHQTKSFKLFTAISQPTQESDLNYETETNPDGSKFDWYSEWYPIMPVRDMDKRAPHGKRVIGLDVVAWWDRNESQWKVFGDSCPHRLAPLSEGRIDKWGRLQCVYHGWCFNGKGDCKLIPQAPQDGPPVHTSKKACAVVYPSTVQNHILWFYPNADPQFKDILNHKKPPCIPELDNLSFISVRDIPYGYEVLIENLMDPAHVAYAHYGIMTPLQPRSKADREGGVPLDLSVTSLDPNGFVGIQDPGVNRFFAPCVFYTCSPAPGLRNQDNGAASSHDSKEDEKRLVMAFYCIPVSPGRSRLIATVARNFFQWFDIVPQWMIHLFHHHMIVDSDLYLLHVEEHKIMEVGADQWHKACFVPTKSDVHVIAFRKWLNKYAGGQVDWRGRFPLTLPPTPPREHFMDRYWTHVVNCSSCNAAYKRLKVLKVVLQFISISVLGIVAVTNNAQTSVPAKAAMVSFAVLCFAASKWLTHFIHKFFHFHDYNHAFK